MGYEVHVRRGEDGLDAAENPITLDEWRSYVASCDDLRMDDFAETQTPDGLLRIEAPGIAVWTAHPRLAEAGAWITWRDGTVQVNGPDEVMIRRLHEIAEALGARVQGEEGELYGRDGRPVEGEPEPEPPTPRRGLFRRRRG